MPTPESENPANAPQNAGATPQTRGQNPDRAHEGAHQAEAATTTPDDATQRGGYAGSAQGDYDNRDGSPRREGGGQSNPAPTNASSEPGDRDGYVSAAARQGSVAEGTGSRGGSYNDQNANAPHAEGAPKAPTRPADGPDSGGASTRSKPQASGDEQP